MIAKFLVSITMIIVILLSLIVILQINSEENKGKFISDKDKFIGKWNLVYNEADSTNDEVPDTTEEPDNFIANETYELLSNGTYYHIVDEDNFSGSWTINNSILVLTVDDPFGVIPISNEYVFSDNSNRVTLNIVEDPKNLLEFEKITV